MNDPIRMTAHAIGAALDFNEIDAEDMFVDAPSYDALASQLAEVQSMRNAEAKTAQALIDALRTQNTALIKQMGISVANERQWGKRVAGLEAELEQARASLKLHDDLKEARWTQVIEGKERIAALEADLQEMTCGDAKTLLERTLQAGYDIQTRQRDEIRELRKALGAVVAVQSPADYARARNAAIDLISTPAASPPRRDQICSNEYSELGTLVSTPCAICDQIKELHPATHPWTAKSTAESPLCRTCGRPAQEDGYVSSCSNSFHLETKVDAQAIIDGFLEFHEIVDHYPVGTLFQKKPSGQIVAMTPDGETTMYEPTSRPVMNPPADEAEARNRANTAPTQPDSDGGRRVEIGLSSEPEARPVMPTARSLDEVLGVGKEGRCIMCGDPLELPPRDPKTCDHVSPLTGKPTVMGNGECYLCDSTAKIKGDDRGQA